MNRSTNALFLINGVIEADNYEIERKKGFLG